MKNELIPWRKINDIPDKSENGIISELQIYTFPLTPEQIEAIFKNKENT